MPLVICAPNPSSTLTGYPLDDITNSATHAYSVRKLRSAYSGNVLRLRRGSDSVESDFGFSGDNLDTAAIATWLGAASGYVVTWYDQSGNGRDVTNATASAQPLYVASIASAGNRPGLRFDGSDDVLGSATGTFGQTWTYFVLVRASATWNQQNILCTWERQTGGNGYLMYYQDNYRFNAGSSVIAGAADTNYNLLTAQFGGSSRLWISGAPGSVVNPGGGGRAGLGIGANTWFGNIESPLAGDECEAIALAGTLTATDHNTLGDSAATYFGLSWTTVT